MRDQRGSASIVTAAIVAMTVALGLGAADLARVLVSAAKAQTAADAAALAAAQELAFPTEREPSELALEYAARNDAELIACECDPGTFEAAVVVVVHTGDLLLLGGSREVHARARAVVSTSGAGSG